ncbi:MAG: peptidylprolyl isomerase [Saprospiraceae bacterium]|nr:peptidylprolyl isomerase [Saprospiraceae bacterium]
MKNILSVIPCLLLSTLLSAQSDRAVIERVVATVGGEIILLSEVQEQFSYAKQQQADLPDEYRCVVLQNLIVQKILVNQAKLDSIDVKDEEVETQLAARVDRLMLYFSQDEKALEEYYGQSVNDIKDQMRGDMRSQLLAERMQADVTGKATITPAEVQTFFANIPADSLPYFNAEVEIREIVAKPKVNPVEKERARVVAEDLRKRIVDDGEDFATLAKKYSADTGSGANGGDLSWQKRGTFVAPFEAMAYKLEKNQVSPLVETEFGFHIIQLLERRGNLIHCRHILIKPEITQADINLVMANLDTVRQLIIDRSLLFTAAVKKYGDKNQQSFNNDGRVANPRSGNTFFEVADLDTDIFFAIDGLQPGDITEPFEFKSEDGTKLYRIVLLQSRSKPHKADLGLDYGKIQTAALEQRKTQLTEKWVMEKLRTTYLSVGQMFGNCDNLEQLLQEQESATNEK